MLRCRFGTTRKYGKEFHANLLLKDQVRNCSQDVLCFEGRGELGCWMAFLLCFCPALLRSWDSCAPSYPTGSHLSVFVVFPSLLFSSLLSFFFSLSLSLISLSFVSACVCVSLSLYIYIYKNISFFLFLSLNVCHCLCLSVYLRPLVLVGACHCTHDPDVICKFQSFISSARFEIRAACYRIEKRGNPENSWGGCWEECCEISGCGRECWRGCCSSFLSKESPSRSILASTPNFRSTLPNTLPSYFLDFPVSLFYSRPPGSQRKVHQPVALEAESTAHVGAAQQDLAVGACVSWFISGPQKGPAERGHVKKRQKVSNIFFDIFRAGQKTSKIVKHLFRQFSRGTIFPAPFRGL